MRACDQEHSCYIDNSAPGRLFEPTALYEYKLYKNLSKNSVRKSFFSERVVNIWNFLPADIVNFTSLSSFRRTIYSTSIFLVCYNVMYFNRFILL